MVFLEVLLLILIGIAIGYFGKPQIDVFIKNMIKQLSDLKEDAAKEEALKLNDKSSEKTAAKKNSASSTSKKKED